VVVVVDVVVLDVVVVRARVVTGANVAFGVVG
jgi:hypothetical protein